MDDQLIVIQQADHCMDVCRLLDWVAGLTATAGPEERLQGEAALQLSVRLGLKPAAMLAVLLSSSAGVTFYHHFPAAVRMIFRPGTACRDWSASHQGA